MRGRITLFALVFSASVVRAGDPAPNTAAVRGAVARSLPLLQRGAKTFRERSEGRCIACHHQGLILQTVALARERGFTIDEKLASAEVERVRTVMGKLADTVLDHDYVPYKPSADAVRRILDRADPGFARLLERVRDAFDPDRRMNPGRW